MKAKRVHFNNIEIDAEYTLSAQTQLAATSINEVIDKVVEYNMFGQAVL